MPDVWSHYFFAKQVMTEERLPIEHKDLYYLGAQGPDILFYQAFEPGKKAKLGTPLARLLHQTKTDKLLQFVFSWRERAKAELKDYLSGFLSHYALDSSLHPMIHRLKEDGPEHKGFEMALDMKLYQVRRPGKSIHQASIRRQIAPRRALPEPIVQFYVDLAREVFSKEIDPELIRESYRDFRRFHGLSNLGGVFKKPVVEFILKRFAPNYACYFYGDFVAGIPISDEVWEEFWKGFLGARELFSRLNQSIMPERVVNFSGNILESHSGK